MVNRKLVRPNLAEIKERLATQPHVGHEPPYRDANADGAARRRPAPPEGTAAEAFYYLHTQDKSCWTHELQLTPFSTKPSF